MHNKTYEITVEDHECPRPDGSMLIRVARPQGEGPFPAVVDIHGGGWVTGDRKQNALIDDTLAANGIIAAAPEFRMPFGLAQGRRRSDAQCVRGSGARLH